MRLFESGDRANRLLSSAGVTTAYDGLGNRVTRTVSGTTTRHLLDLQPGLTQVLSATTVANVTRHVHAQGDLLAHKDSAGNWEWMLNDGLGSVRGVVSNAGSVLEHRHFDPFGNLYAGTMAQTDFGFTGEPFDATSGLVYLRARHYRPANGTFASRDPFEGTMTRPMSRNGYSWVEGRVADGRDPSGMVCAISSYNALRERSTLLLDYARKWNRIPVSDCISLGGSSNVVRNQCLNISTPSCSTTFSDEAFAYLMASILHQEAMLQEGLEAVSSSFRDNLGVIAGYFSGYDASVGIAQLRPSRVRELFSGIIVGPDNSTIFTFDTSRLQNAMDVRQDIEMGLSPIENDPFYQYMRELKFLRMDDVSMDLLGANIYRGIIRINTGVLSDVRTPSVFNLAAWHNTGIQGGIQNPYDAKAVTYANLVMQHMVDFVEGNCDLGFGTRPIPWSDFMYYNNTDEPHIQATWSGLRANITWGAFP